MILGSDKFLVLCKELNNELNANIRDSSHDKIIMTFVQYHSN